MKPQNKKKIIKTVIILGVIVILVGLVYVLSIKTLPVRVVTDYAFSTLWEEGTTMHECAECHETEEFHTCSTCHDEHGSVELAGLNFYNMIELTGDIPEVKFIPANHFFTYYELPNTFITIDEFMEKWEIPAYESLTIYTRDGEFVRIQKDDITDQAMFLPYEDGIRFASEDLHISTWAKGIAKLIIISEDKPLRINGQATSIGRLLLGKTTSISIEEAKVMFISENDGLNREAITSTRIEGAALSDLVDVKEGEEVRFILEDGSSLEVTIEELEGSILTKQRDAVVLVLPQKSRKEWIYNITSIEEITL